MKNYSPAVDVLSTITQILSNLCVSFYTVKKEQMFVHIRWNKLYKYKDYKEMKHGKAPGLD